MHRRGEPLDQLSIIATGEVEATLDGHTFTLGKTDVIGLCDLFPQSHSRTYTAVSDVTVYQYPCDGIGAADALLRGNADIGYLMVSSLCRQVADLLQFMSRLKHEAQSAYELVNELYPKYERLCKLYGFASKKLPGLPDITIFPESLSFEDWLCDYYMELRDLNPGAHKNFFYSNPGISSGFIRRCADDTVRVAEACHALYEYIKSISQLLLDSGGLDLFSVISELHVGSVNIKGADEAVEALIEPLTWLLSDLTGVDHDYFQARLDAYGDELSAKRASQVVADAPVIEGMSQNLKDSLETILKYSDCPEELCNKFTRCVRAYTDLPDRISSDDEAYDLRKDLTSMFYEIYQHVFVKSLSDPTPPTVIKMFLNFGYVDPALAGYENADYLYSVADSVKGDPSMGVYTICEWLTAIYNGEVEPSLSEFDMDYPAFVRDLKRTQKLDDGDVARLLANQDRKLRYEMENAFPVVNRITFGNPSKFCPLFADHNLLRRIGDILVTPQQIKDALDYIRGIDFSAFYRSTSYSNHKIGVPNETVSVEIMPNFILMPNIGVRGSMWQEVEGRVRTTASRMFMPMFLDNDVKTLVMRMTGEFRWEICKRVQGARWNDVTDPSLTSLYSDYLQFYMNNRSISMPTMLDIRNELSSARNNFKTVFVSNYVVWLQNESNGSARLNSIATTVLMTFCPFAAPIREKLANNMRYAEPLSRYRARQSRRVQHLNKLIQRLRQQGKQPPQELLDELEHAKR